MRTKWILLAGFCFMMSCQKEDVGPPYRISELIQNQPEAYQYRLQLRLAFGKTLAAALQDPSFRRWVKERSNLQNEKPMFRELVYALEKDQRVIGDMTLERLLDRHVSCEVRNFFGDRFLDRVLQDDPCVTFKLPDVFYGLEWQEAAIIPYVYVETPVPLDVDGSGVSYAVYHSTGSQDLITYHDLFELPRHFCLLVKYSEDHTLMNTETLQNEKGIGFYEFLPQALENGQEFLDLVFGESQAYPLDPKFRFVNKYKAYRLWRLESAYQGPLLSEQFCSQSQCIRGCGDTSEVTTSLKEVKFHSGRYASLYGILFRENAHILVAMTFPGSNLNNRVFAIPGIRVAEFSKPFGSVTLKQRHFRDIHGKLVILPEIAGQRNPDPETEPIPVGGIVVQGWPDGPVGFACVNTYYSDGVVTKDLNFSTDLPGIQSFKVHSSSEKLTMETGGLYFCDPPGVNIGGSLGVYFDF